MKTCLIIAAAAAAALLAGCATADPTTASPDEKRYATGSNIPMRNRDVHTMTPEAFEEMRNQSRGNTGRRPGQ